MTLRKTATLEDWLNIGTVQGVLFFFTGFILFGVAIFTGVSPGTQLSTLPLVNLAIALMAAPLIEAAAVFLVPEVPSFCSGLWDVLKGIAAAIRDFYVERSDE